MPNDYVNFWHLRSYLQMLSRKQYYTPQYKKWWCHSRLMYTIFVWE